MCRITEGLPPEIRRFLTKNYPPLIAKRCAEFYKQHGELPPTITGESHIPEIPVIYMPAKHFMALYGRKTSGANNSPENI